MAAVAFAVAACAGAPGAYAQARRADLRDRQLANAGTVFGDPHAQACGQYAATANASEEALEACSIAIQSEQLDREDQVATIINRGVIHLRRQDGAAALADFDAALEMDEENAEALLNRGAALIMLRQPGPAVAAITQALSLGVNEPHKAYLNRGAAREALGDLRGAYEDYSTALEIQPDWGPANAELARFARGRQEHLATVLNENGAP